jgi:hypothetical protein
MDRHGSETRGSVVGSLIQFSHDRAYVQTCSLHSHLSFLSPFISTMHRWHRTTVLVASSIGALLNSVLAVQLFALWRSLKWDSESEWEGSLDPWTVNTLSLLGGLSAAYFVTAAVASAIGFAGIVKVSLSNAPRRQFIQFVRCLNFAGRATIRSILSRFFRCRLHVLYHLHPIRHICFLQLLFRPLQNLRGDLATRRSHAGFGGGGSQLRELRTMVREGRHGLCWHHVCHHRHTGKRARLFASGARTEPFLVLAMYSIRSCTSSS